MRAVSRTTLAVGIAGLVATLLVAGCSSSQSSSANGSPAATTQLEVFAAASLTDVFTKFGTEFQAANPGVHVNNTFAGSSTLARQINDGSPADVFAAASPETMDTVINAGNAQGAPAAFTSNTLAVIVPTANPGKITKLSDLANPGLKIVLCDSQVPCGAAADQMLANANLVVTPASREPDVRSVLAKIANGEADAGVVYSTDAKTRASEVAQVPIPAADNVITQYQIVAIKSAGNSSLAAEWIAFVQAPAQQAALQAAGFGTAKAS